MNFKVQKACVVLFLLISTINIFASDAGRHFILTLPKYNAANQYDEWLEKTRPSGVMLQEYHMQDRVKAKQLCTRLQSKAKDLKIYPLLICVDYEGGIVSRGADVGGFISVPSPYRLAGVGKHECFLGGKLIGQQLQDTGIVVNFAPSVDLFDEGNYILATRCFASDPNIVAGCAISFVHGHNKAGVLPVIKHFPGLRLGKWDTHTSSVVKIDLSAQDFENSVLPFKRVLEQDLPVAVMVGHAQYAQFNNESASMSPSAVSWIRQYSKKALIIVDDIAMQAFHKAESEDKKLQCMCDSAVKSIQSGLDLLIFSASDVEQVEMINKLNSMKIASPTDVRTKIKEIYSELKKAEGDLLNERETAVELAKKSVACDVTPIPADNKIIVISVDLPKIRPATSFEGLEKDNTGRRTLLTTLLGNNGYNVSEFIVNPMEKDAIEKLKNLTYTSLFQESDNIILQTFFYGGGVWNQNQQEWLNLLNPYAKKVTIFSLGHPLEKKYMSNAQVIELGSFHSIIINAAFDLLKKKR